METAYYSIADAARLLGIAFYKVSYAVKTSVVRPRKLLNRYALTEGEVRQLARHFATPLPAILRSNLTEGTVVYEKQEKPQEGAG